MTNRYLHCPFCANNIDANSGTYINFGLELHCDNCDTYFTLLMDMDDFYKKAHGGLCTKIQDPCDMEGTG